MFKFCQRMIYDWDFIYRNYLSWLDLMFAEEVEEILEIKYFFWLDLNKMLWDNYKGDSKW